MILIGDNRIALATIPDRSVQCCVTSPPYWGLRDYGHDGQIGLEQTPDEYVSQMVAVFRQVHRVLRDDGTLWLNLGDSYSSMRDSKAIPDTLRGDGTGTAVGSAANRNPANLRAAGLKHKDLVGIPWRVAFALQADGWYLRQDIIWHKPNPMPESVGDRCTKAHEYIFLLTKNSHYFFDAEAIKEPAKYAGDNRGARSDSRRGTQMNSVSGATGAFRNKRSVWTVSTKPFKGAHFATFPPQLIEPCILAGSKPGDTILDPFFGAGTTGLVAQRHNRNWIGCELNPEYAEMARKRLETEQNLFTL